VHRGLCCRAEAPGLAGGMGWQESRGVRQRETRALRLGRHSPVLQEPEQRESGQSGRRGLRHLQRSIQLVPAGVLFEVVHTAYSWRRSDKSGDLYENWQSEIQSYPWICVTFCIGKTERIS